MKRFAVVCSLLVGAVTGCDTLFPGPGGGQAGSLTGIGPDGGVCEKDPQTIKNVMLAPPICNATNPCPCGTFCSSQTGGNCVADCVDDSWCAPGHFCSGYGQCLAGSADGGTGDGAGPNVDPSCPRNEALLDSLHVMRRACEFDDICPFGSFCDHRQESCDYECRSDADCAGRNSPGHTFVCGCLGKCAEVAAPRVAATEVLSTVEATPDDFIFLRPAGAITQPVWGGVNERAISVVVVAPFVTTDGTTITGPSVKITANPGPGLQGRCPSGQAMPCDIDIDPATFKKVNDVYRSAPVIVTVAPSDAAPTATNWELRLSSNQISNSPKSIPLRYASAVDNSVGPNYQTIPQPPAPPSGFRGTGYVHIDTPTLDNLQIQVRAREWQGKLVVFDETRQLSPSGKLWLALPVNGTPDLEAFLEPDGDNDPALQISLRGNLLQRLATLNMQRDTNSGSLSGTFTRSVSSDFVFNQSPAGPATSPFAVATNGNFHLMAIASTTGFCDADTDCSGGSTCDMGFCSSGGGTHHAFFELANSTGGGAGFLDHKRSATWGSKYPNPDQNNQSYFGFAGIYMPSSGAFAVADPSAFALRGPLPMVSGEPLADLFTFGGILSQNEQPKAILLLTQGDSPYSPARSQLLSDCLTDLQRDRKNADLNVDTFDTYTPCVNLGRVNMAISDRRTFQRTLQGWLQVHSFIAREGLEEAQLQEATTGIGIPGATSTVSAPALEKIMGAVESGLGYMLDVNSRYNFAPYTVMTPDEIWSAIDYRNLIGQACSGDNDCNVSGSSEPAQRTMQCVNQACRVFKASELPQHEQPIGVPPVILETATAYLRTLEAYLEKIARQSYGAPADASPSNSRAAALRRFGTGMRLVLAAEQMAAGINQKAGACPTSTNPNCDYIKGRFESAATELRTVRARVIAQAEIIRTGRNPFNIPEDDVPLFFGDPTGANSRFFASSDYLINGWAIPAVTQAQSYLDAARGGWIAQMQAKVQDELNQHNRDQEISQLMSKYGSPILANCGNLQVRDDKGDLKLLDSTEVIPYYVKAGADVDSGSCYIDRACTGDEGLDGKIALREALVNAFWNPDRSLNNGQGEAVHAQDEPGRDGFLGSFFIRSEVCKLTFFDETLPNNKFIGMVKQWCPGNVAFNPTGANWCSIAYDAVDGNMYMSTPNSGFIPLAAFYGPIKRADAGNHKFYELATNAPGPDDNIYNFDDIRSNITQYGHYGETLVAPVSQVFTIKGTPYCAGGYKPYLLHADYPRPSRAALPGRCYKGALGVSFHQVQANLLRIRRAKEVLDSGQKGAQDTMELCAKIDSNGMKLAVFRGHYLNMKEAYDDMSKFTGSIEKGVQAGIQSGNFVVGWATAVGNFAKSWFFNDDDIKKEAEEFETMQMKFALEEKSQECWNTFRAQRRALATAMTDVQIASTELQVQAAQFRNLGGQNDLNMQEGRAVLKREQESPLSSLGHHFWVDEKVEQFRKEFEWSRRLAFLAMRAVEYEFQQSLPFRSQIVAATTPAQLQDVMIGLQQEQAARTINRRRPEEASVVVSLRDDVLGIADRSGDPTGERNWTPAERFASRLWDDRYAFRDSDGEYLGQAIPFTLGPIGVLETRCGERLWRATATIQGDGIEQSAPGASVLLLKRNTFSSQYCNGKSPPGVNSSGAVAAGPAMQVGVIHTTAQLFRPGANVDLSDADQFTASLLYPWFNVRRTDFYRTGFRDGASEELAGRGLYGDYVLLFPKQVLEDGMALDKVEDVLLRLDYLSVDNLSQ